MFDSQILTHDNENNIKCVKKKLLSYDSALSY